MNLKSKDLQPFRINSIGKAYKNSEVRLEASLLVTQFLLVRRIVVKVLVPNIFPSYQ